MEHLKMQTADMADRNIEQIGALFPECLTERINSNGRVEQAIDFDKLRQLLAHDVVEGPEQRYQFTWPDKRAANRLANTPTTMTLRPCREESVDFDHTQNLYIEGDNLDVLKALRETYLGKVKMIYIDPPYNTGNDFVYNDDFAQSRDEFEKTSGLFDEEGNQTIDPMQRNTESNGRFHTDWLNMIYPRLKVARDLLSEDGVIFISIDDNEVENLKKNCSEIFGESNFVANVIWKHTQQSKNDELYFSRQYNHTLCYSKDKLR
ncbi:MAG TPA: site-specific DNA-methyltransferase, partial [Bacteroidetes bacterium]|nr:site-specific DNA-methyltransferase [Candidatus Limimorpha avicola]